MKAAEERQDQSQLVAERQRRDEDAYVAHMRNEDRRAIRQGVRPTYFSQDELESAE